MERLVVLGARGLGGALLDHFLAAGWSAAAVARSAETLDAVRHRGAVAIEADALDPDDLARAMADAREQLGGIDLIVNAPSVTPPAGDGPWGGGPVADAELDAWQAWTAAISRVSFVFLSEGTRALRAGGSGGTLIQIANGSAVRPTPGSGLVAGGQQSLRALTRSAAQDLRAEGIRACLLIVDAPVGPARDPATTADPTEIAQAVAFLAGQGPSGAVYELMIRPAGLPWVLP